MKINQKGSPRFREAGFAHLFLIIILVAGIALAVYLVQQRTNILPFASEPPPCPISGPCPTVSPPQSFGKAISLITGQGTDRNLSFVITRSDMDSLLLKDPFTVEFWFRINQLPNSDMLLLGQGNRLKIILQKNGFIKITTSDGTKTETNTWGTSVAMNAWHHFAFMYKNGYLTLYMDGKYIAYYKAPYLDDKSTTIVVGTASNGAIEDIDEVRISNIARYPVPAGGGTYDVPVAPFSDDGNTQILFHIDGNLSSAQNISNYRADIIGLGGITKYIDSINNLPPPTPPPTLPPTPTPTPPGTPKPTPSLTPTPKPVSQATDFNGDGKSDLAIFRTTENKWYVKGLPATSWGRADQGDVPVPADYDGDGKSDYAVFHASNQPNQSFFYIKYANGKEANINMSLWDGTGYIPVPADYNGDGKVDPAVWDPVGGSWRGPDMTNTPWGRADQGDIPAPGDYDGDGKADFAVYHPSTKEGQSAFYIRYSNGKEAYPVFPNIVDGTGGIPVQADYNGDGKTDPAVVIPNYQLSVGQHRWFIQMDETKYSLGERMFDWGRGSNSIPVIGDYNGDGKADAAVWDSNDGMWYIRGVMNTPWGRGDQGDIPLPKTPSK